MSLSLAFFAALLQLGTRHFFRVTASTRFFFSFSNGLIVSHAGLPSLQPCWINFSPPAVVGWQHWRCILTVMVTVTRNKWSGAQLCCPTHFVLVSSFLPMLIFLALSFNILFYTVSFLSHNRFWTLNVWFFYTVPVPKSKNLLIAQIYPTSVTF